MLDQQYELRHLNDEWVTGLRRLMVEELHWSLMHDKIYYSKHFTEFGHKEYPPLLEKALAEGNPDTLEESLNIPRSFQSSTPSNAAQMFAWDEFNKYYMRALCRMVQTLPNCRLIVVRARYSSQPKPESNRLLGTEKNALKFLAELREVPKINPFGANSGLTLELR